MPEQKLREIEEAAEVIVNGYAMMNSEFGVTVVNLDTGHASVYSPEDKLLESSMDDIESVIALNYLKRNRQFLVK